MITYALSTSAFGSYMTEAAAEAVRQSRFRNFEFTLSTSIVDDEQSRLSARLTRQLIGEGV
ncbi:MAG: hypothetical protein IKO93_13625, partial [Lentisphaeria bacterium]|nr:hypothetical protein [Lentisphaeria bacterium]